MGPTWSLSVFLLGYVYGMPINFHNSTRQNETLFERNYTLDNSTEFVETNDTGISPFQMIISTQYLVSTGEKSPNQQDMLDSLQQRKDKEYNVTTEVQSWNGTESDGNMTMLTPMKLHVPYLRGVSRVKSCQLSICALINLSHEMQSGGDEKAGRATTDPHGIGKR
ncbi:uncharacterized protein LOC134038031 isoform X1 [Osmerus eperlanus]|uniref:uncharacterized protein LOC134038031 isoform X1 n=1 Tax=Osmerus eperlanus TaxID=29151 RepID=UPI002E15DB4C